MKTALFTKVLGERPLESVIEIAAVLGYDGVELMGREPHLGLETTDAEARALREHASDLGVDLVSLATYTGHYTTASDAECEDELARFERFCELADVLDVQLVRNFPGGPSPYDADDEAYDRAARWVGRAADVAADHELTVGVEIHTDSVAESAADAVRLLDAVGRENVVAIHDAGNMYICDEQYGPASVETLGGSLGHVHVKDVRRTRSLDGGFTIETRHGEESFAFARLGRGDVDHWRLFRALADSGYDGYVTDECFAPAEGPAGDVTVAAHELGELERLIETSARATAGDRRSEAGGRDDSK